MGEPDGLRPVIEVQIRLFCGYPVETGGLDLGEHIRENARIGLEDHDAGVEVEREASVVREHVRGRREDERELEELVKVLSDVGVCVEVDGGLDADGVERPDSELGVLVDEGWPDALSVVRRLDEIDRVEFPADVIEVALGRFGYAVGKEDCDLPGVGVGFCEGVSEGGDGDGVRVGIEGGYDSALIASGCGGVGVLGRGSVVSDSRPVLTNS